MENQKDTNKELTLDEKRQIGVDINRKYAELRGLSDRDKRNLGFNPATGERLGVTDQGLIGTAKLFAKDLFVGLDDTDTAGISRGAEIGVGGFQSILGSKGGVADVFQNIGKQTAGLLDDDSVSNTRSQLSNLISDTQIELNNTKDPKRKEILTNTLNSLNEQKEDVNELVEDTNISIKEAAGTGIASGLNLVSLGVGIGGKSALAAVKPTSVWVNGGRVSKNLIATEAILGGGQAAAYTLGQKDFDEVNFGDVLDVALGSAFEVAIPFVSRALKPVFKPLADSINRLRPTKKELLRVETDQFSKSTISKSQDIVSANTTDEVKDIVGDSLNRIFKDVDGSEETEELIYAILAKTNNVNDVDTLVDAIATSIKRGDSIYLKDAMELIGKRVTIRNIESDIFDIENRRIADEALWNEVPTSVKQIVQLQEDLVKLQRELDSIVSARGATQVKTKRELELESEIAAKKKSIDNLAGTNNNGIIPESELALKQRIDGYQETIDGLRAKTQQPTDVDSDLIDIKLNEIKERSNNLDILNENTFGMSKKDIKEYKASNLTTRKTSTGMKGWYNELDALVFQKIADTSSVLEDVLRKFGVEDGGIDQFNVIQRTNMKRGRANAMNSADLVKVNEVRSVLYDISNEYGIERIELLDEFSEYSIAKNALDVNKVKKGELIMSTSKANGIIERFELKYKDKLNVLEAQRNKITDLHFDLLLRRVESGDINPEQFKRLREQYPNYVPSIVEVDGKMVEILTDVRFTRSDQIKNVDFKGDGNIQNIFKSTVQNSEAINAAVTNNEANLALLRTITKNKDNEFGKMFEVKEVKSALLEAGERAIVVRDSGKFYKISSGNNRLLRDFENILPKEHVFEKLSFYGNAFNKIYASLYTGLNPAFKIPSIIYNFTENLVNYAALGGKGFVGPLRIRDATKALGDFKKGKIGKYHEETKFAIENGLVSNTFNDQINIFKGKKKFNLDEDLDTRNPISSFINATDSIENGLRLATYLKGIKDGFSPREALNIAKRSMINFDVQGEATKYFKPLYIFSNVIAQTNRNIAQLLRSPETMAKIAVTTSAAAYGLDTINESIYPGWRDVYSDWEKDSNIIIVIGTKENGKPLAIKIPLAHILRPIWTLENGLIEYANGDVELSKIASRSMYSLVNNLSITGNQFTSTDGESTGLGLFTPTALKPLSELYENKNFFGKEVIEYDKDGNPTELKEGYGEKGSEALSLEISDWIRDLTGDESKYTDPRIFNQLIKGYLLTGVLNDVDKTRLLFDKLKAGEEVEFNEIPIANRLITEARDYEFENAKYKELDRNLNKSEDANEQAKSTYRFILQESTPTEMSDPRLWRHKKDDSSVKLKGDIFYNKFTTDTRNLDFVNYVLNGYARDGITEEQRNNYLLSLKNNNPEQYRYFIEWEIASDTRLLQMNKSQIKAYMEDRGVLTPKASIESINKKALSIARNNTNTDIDYQALIDVSNSLNESGRSDLQPPTTEQINLAHQANNSLYQQGLITKSDHKRRNNKLYDAWTEGIFNHYLRKYSKGEIQLDEFITMVETDGSPDSKKRLLKYLEDNNY